MITINGTEITELKYNGVEIEKAICNGVVVFEERKKNPGDISIKTSADSIKLRVTTKDGSPCELWNGAKKIAEMQSGTHQTVSIPNNAEEILIKGKDIQGLDCPNNRLTALDVSGCTSLQRLECYNNQLTAFDVSGCTRLQRLHCDRNQITSLNISGCTSLQHLYCYYNQLTTLNVSGLTSLEVLECYRNRLTTLNASGCTSLKRLVCFNNQLTSLAVSDLTSLQWLDCSNNKLSAEVFKKLFEDLPERKEKDGRVLLYKDGDSNYKDFPQPPELAAAFKAAKEKGWKFYKNNWSTEI
ncbi:leucine-rich repeat domain-containing protein [Treponema phagedenis]|uniref:leucine-rich repeat domain-containing protein n=1 Tax=Treponema phagedenis TaxID=162 RepID=UPI00158214EF|nr:leucine-rich repeat domain-containing protein [Treponema phagedenis]QKS93028.1 leucine-rich repeat domain-containing protein [Treponema phagedenis]